MRRIIAFMLALLCGPALATNEYYSHVSGVPATGSLASSATMRAEFDAISTGFSYLPTLSGNANLPIFVNSGASGLSAISASTARTNLGLGSIATQNSSSVSITGGTITGTTESPTSLTVPSGTTLPTPTLTGTVTASSTTLNLTNATVTATGATVSGGTYSSPTINSPTISNITFSGGITFSGNNPDFTGTPKMNSVTGLAGQVPQMNAAATAVGWWVPRGYLGGLTMSTAGSSTTMTVAAGEASDSTNVSLMKLTSSINKTTSGWSVGSGNGCLDTGSIANSTWYHFYEVMRPDTGVVDVLCSLSASSPTMPTNYTLKRRVGAGKTDGSGNWTLFVQIGDYFTWKTPVAETVAGSGSTTTLIGIPAGIRVRAIFEGFDDDASSGITINSRTTDTGFTAGPGFGSNSATPGGSHHGNPGRSAEWSDTAAGIVFAYSSSVTLSTRGWMDYRGRMD